ncbi:MAG: 5'-methylthioadenosine/S-adenosylhomocysteine nucleosidase [Sedimentisphaerales bacterium]|nr:5'-methylthioadenosine/S-adenosylhomocysteine nucleosidase [Sedimentisphaerales bacterium]
MPIADIAIICALDIEAKAMLEAIGDMDRSHFKLGPFDCHYGHIKRNGDECYPIVRVVVLHLGRMGNLASMQAATLLLREVHPSQVFLVGICGGFAETQTDYCLGDIVVSDKVYYYEPQKLWPDRVEHRGVELFCPVEGETKYTPSKLYLLAEKKKSESNLPFIEPLSSLISTPYPHGDSQHFKPTVRTGTVCSGEKVVADESFVKSLLIEKTNAISVEMEAAGVAAACQDAKTPFLVVKAVSDFTNLTPDWQATQRTFAAEAAAAYTIALITYPYHVAGGVGKTKNTEGLVLSKRCPPKSFLTDFFRTTIDLGVDVVMPSYKNYRHSDSGFRNYPFNEYETAFDDVYCSFRIHPSLIHLIDSGIVKFKFDQQLQNGLLKNKNIILIGSSVANDFTQDILIDFNAFYHFGDNESNDHDIVDRNGKTCFAAKVSRRVVGGEVQKKYIKDYGLISVFHDGSRSICILAGCRAFSQMLLGDWLVEGNTIEGIYRHIYGCDFQLIIKVKVAGRSYNFEEIAMLKKREENSSEWRTVNLPTSLIAKGESVQCLL